MKKLVLALLAVLVTTFSVRAAEIRVSAENQATINTQMADLVEKLRNGGMQTDIKTFLRTNSGVVPAKQLAFLKAVQGYLDAGASYDQVKRGNNSCINVVVIDQINNSTVPNNPPVAAGKRPKWCDFANIVLNFVADAVCNNNGIKWTPIDWFSWWP